MGPQATLCFRLLGRKNAHEQPTGGHFVISLGQCSCSSSQKGAVSIPTAELMLLCSAARLSWCNGPSPCIFSTFLTVQGDTANLLVMTRMNAPPCRSWTICAIWLGCRSHLTLPVVTSTLAKSKTREENHPGSNSLSFWWLSYGWFFHITMLIFAN